MPEVCKMHVTESLTQLLKNIKGIQINMLCIYRPPPHKANKVTIPWFLTYLNGGLGGLVVYSSDSDFTLTFHMLFFFVKTFLEFLDFRRNSQSVHEPGSPCILQVTLFIFKTDYVLRSCGQKQFYNNRDSREYNQTRKLAAILSNIHKSFIKKWFISKGSSAYTYVSSFYILSLLTLSQNRSFSFHNAV